MKTEKLVFCGIGQYNKAIQGIFKSICIFNDYLTGGWLDTSEKIFVTEKAIICRLNSFSHFLIKALLRREKEFLIAENYTFQISSENENPEGFTHFENSNVFIVPQNMQFIPFNKF